MCGGVIKERLQERVQPQPQFGIACVFALPDLDFQTSSFASSLVVTAAQHSASLSR